VSGLKDLFGACPDFPEPCDRCHDFECKCAEREERELVEAAIEWFEWSKTDSNTTVPFVAFIMAVEKVRRRRGKAPL
jgi:hypothetical protein